MKKGYRICYLTKADGSDNIILPTETVCNTVIEAEVAVKKMIGQDNVSDWIYFIIPQYSKK